MKRKSIITGLLIILSMGLGILIGVLFFNNNEQSQQDQKVESASETTTWTCSMHPQVRQSEPGQCPICGMDLIPLSASDEGGVPAGAVSMSETATKLAKLQTMKVTKEGASKTIRLNGKVEPNEKLVQTQSSHVAGRVEVLLVNTTGERVSKGQKLAEIYSPQLVSAQRELLQTYDSRESQPALYRAAREKLRSFRISQSQINEIIANDKVQETLSLYSDRNGIVLEKMVKEGDYLSKGESILTIADLSEVWVVFDAYESDLPFLDEGDKLSFEVASLPGRKFEGTITFIDPIVNPQTRVAEVRVVAENSELQLKPQMFATARVEAKIGGDDQIVVPKSAVMWTGERSVVYVKVGETGSNNYKLREVTLGPALQNAYVIERGLQSGEEVVVHGTFTIDAAAQLAGKPSMMNPEGTGTRAHDHLASDASPEMRIEVSEHTMSQISEVLQSYFSIKDALVASNSSEASSLAHQLKEAAAAVNINDMPKDARESWEKLSSQINSALAEIIAKSNIDVQRKSFVQLSKTMVKVAQSFGPFEETIYVMYCPMANDDVGANWLSTSNEVLNPYYGEMMLKCGEVTQQIK